jgi:bifunctional non-homologous end joining protein LigD
MATAKPVPRFVDGLRPMLIDEHAFDLSAPGWVYEIKHDGYRCLAEFGNGMAFLRSKGGADMTKWFPEVARALAAVPGGPHVTDGEVVVLDDIGRSDFDRLHARALRRRFVEGGDAVVYCAFDVLVRDGEPVMDRPLLTRKAMLSPLLAGVDRVLPVGHFDSDGRVLFEQAVIPLQSEGLVAKRPDSIYRPGERSPDWVKVRRKGAIPACAAGG